MLVHLCLNSEAWLAPTAPGLSSAVCAALAPNPLMPLHRRLLAPADIGRCRRLQSPYNTTTTLSSYSPPYWRRSAPVRALMASPIPQSPHGEPSRRRPSARTVRGSDSVPAWGWREAAARNGPIPSHAIPLLFPCQAITRSSARLLPEMLGAAADSVAAWAIS
jgi:hypothetical protein